MSEIAFGLPRKLDDGLLLRWATPEDTEAVAEFNILVHSHDPEKPNKFLGSWTRDLMSDYHPTSHASDTTIVVDQNTGGKIVSTMNLISQTWSYEGIPFAVGRPELVGTDPAYRRKKLVRYQFEAIHAKSKSRGEIVQAITGIPWFYRQLGYEMCVNLGGSRPYYWDKQKNEKPLEEEIYMLRDVTQADLPVLDMLYGRFCSTTPLYRLRNPAQWQYELFDARRDSPYARKVKMIESKTGELVGYIETNPWRDLIAVREIAIAEGYGLREIALFICRALKTEAETRNLTLEKPINRITFEMGESHPIYEALDWELDKPYPPYAWYMRVTDIPTFLRHITPVLEKRLATSTMAGFSGETKLNLYRSWYEMTWENGRLQDIQPYQPDYFEHGNAFFPNLTFFQLLFGHRSLKELDASFPDCFVKDADSFLLLDAIFPKRPSLIIPLG